jgi:hypothetical protein
MRRCYRGCVNRRKDVFKRCPDCVKKEERKRLNSEIWLMDRAYRQRMQRD